MALSAFALCTLLSASASSTSIYVDEDCPRIRQALHLLTEDERLVYVEGLHGIRANGKYQIIVEAHSEHGEIHHGSSSFFYHSYYVWEVETQIRKLGGKFECFSMPYYDYTVDAGNERHPMILNSVFGGNGDDANLNCVFDEVFNLWNVEAWPLKETCDASEDPEQGCCLKRTLYDQVELSDAVQVAGILETPTFREMSGGVGVEHLKVHQLFGKDCTGCAMATEFSADDPIFMILHSFTAYLRALWGACHGYDHVDAKDLQDYPDVYDPTCILGWADQCGVIELDDVYEFERMSNSSWSLTSSIDITPRMMYDFADWGVMYDHGSFVLMSGIEDSRVCDRKNIEQSKWFTRSRRTIADVQGVMDEIEAQNCQKNVTEQEGPTHNDASQGGGGGDTVQLLEIAVVTVVLLLAVGLIGIKIYSFSAKKHDYSLLENVTTQDMYGTIKQ